MNTSLARGVNMPPYEIVFGQKPRVDYELWKLIDDQDITLEEDLPSSIRQRLAEDDTSGSFSSNSTSTDNTDQQETLSSIVTTNCIQNSVRLPISDATSDSAELPQAAQPTREPEPIQAADTLNNNNIETQQFDEETNYDIASTSSRHSEIRKRATKTYLSNANKKIKIHDEFIKDLSFKCSIGSYVGIKINKVDRTNTDPKILPAVVLEKKKDKIKVACEFGIINQWWSLDSIALLSAVPENLVNLQTSELKEISFITASKSYVRGGIDGVTCSCKGGFDTILGEHIECGTKNSLYTSSQVQNEIIDCIHKYILNEILHRVENCLYSIIVDETTDASTAEQLSLSLRYYDQKTNDIREDFLTFIETVSCTGETIANIVLDYLTTHNLPFDNCVGQAYDGASNMAGIYRGCQALIKSKCPDAEYYHCSNHCLNLALVDSSSISQIRNMMGTIKEIINFFTDSPKRMHAFRSEIMDYKGEYICLTNKKRLLGLCDTRWVDRNSSIETFLELYIPIVNTLDKFRYGTLKNSTAEQLYHAITNFEHMISTCISCFLLSDIVSLNRLLQSETLDFSSANQCVDDLLGTFEQRKCQAQDYFHNIIYNHVDELCKELFVTPAIPRHAILALRKNNMPIGDPEQFYRDHVYLPFLEELIDNIKIRLSGLKSERIVLLSKLRPEQIINEKPFELMQHLLKQFANRLSSLLQLNSELERWQKKCNDLLKMNDNWKNKWLNELIKETDNVLFPNVRYLLIFLAALPVSTASAERSFSQLSRIKSYCRSTTKQNRLNGLAAAYIHKDLDINPSEILTLYTQMHHRRLDFGT
ncbi:unnamed protein product [Rotaria sordida]|uniref:Uncharacterized protein n=1 Tax=Rotaria sordida TaxID=392033 RepID=A0A815P591_9BILA|nr:unnamed protein product [Rotaria sordida]